VQRLRQVHALAADDRLARRHEDRAVVARRADLEGAVGGDELALGEGLEADHRSCEGEALVLDHVRAQQLEAARQRGRRRRPVDETEVAEEVLRDLDGKVGAGLHEVLAALDDERRAGPVLAGMAAVLDQRRARAEAGRHHEMHGRSRQRPRDCGVALEGGVDPERRHRLARGMDVEDVIGRRHRRPHLAGAAQLDAVVAAVELRRRPDAVEVVGDEAAVERPGLVEGLVGGDVGEAERQRADLRAHAAVEQLAHRDHAAELVAVREAVDQHVRAGSPRLEAMHVVDAGVAGPVARQVARPDFDRQDRGQCFGAGDGLP